MKNETAYTVDQQTRQDHNANGWERTTWRVTAANKDGARAATLAEQAQRITAAVESRV